MAFTSNSYIFPYRDPTIQDGILASNEFDSLFFIEESANNNDKNSNYPILHTLLSKLSSLHEQETNYAIDNTSEAVGRYQYK